MDRGRRRGSIGPGLARRLAVRAAGGTFEAIVSAERAGAVGMPVYWSNRQGLTVPAGTRPPVLDAPDLGALPGLLTAAGT